MFPAKVIRIILVFCEATDTHGLWEKHKNAMGANTVAVVQHVLRDIRDMVHSMGKDFRTYGLPDVNDAGN